MLRPFFSDRNSQSQIRVQIVNDKSWYKSCQLSMKPKAAAVEELTLGPNERSLKAHSMVKSKVNIRLK